MKCIHSSIWRSLSLPQTTHEPTSSLLRVAQRFALERSGRRTSYIGRVSGLIDGSRPSSDEEAGRFSGLIEGNKPSSDEEGGSEADG